MQFITRRQAAQISNYMYEAQCERDTNSPVENVGVREWICYANSLCQQRQQHAASFIASARGGESFSLSNEKINNSRPNATANTFVIAKQLTLFSSNLKGFFAHKWYTLALGAKEEIFWRMSRLLLSIEWQWRMMEDSTKWKHLPGWRVFSWMTEFSFSVQNLF